MHRVLFLFLGTLVCVLASPIANAQNERRIEVIEAKGIIDGSVERAVIGTIDSAEADDAELVVIQLDSRGVVDEDRGTRLLDRFRSAKVPIAVWIPPAGRAENMAAILVAAARYSAMAPSATIGPIETSDLRSEAGRDSIAAIERFGRSAQSERELPFDRRMGVDRAERANVVDAEASTMNEFLESIDGKRFTIFDERVRVTTDPEDSTVRLHKLDLVGRMLHGAAQPSITYLLLLLALVGIVFELFHPSTGPAGIAGAAALALALYGVVTLGASWFGVLLIAAGVAAFCVDLRYSSLGPFTIGGLIALVSGSLLLFRSPWLRVSPWVLAFGVVSMVAFLVGAMTRVLRDLRAVARGELEVTDAHPHPDGQGGPGDA